MEAIWFYIIAIVLGVILVITYILLIGPTTIVNDIINAFAGFQKSLFSSFSKAY